MIFPHGPCVEFLHQDSKLVPLLVRQQQSVVDGWGVWCDHVLDVGWA